jgi:hypothetical protein
VRGQRLLLVALTLATRARADVPPPPDPAPNPYWVNFEAGEVELDPDLQRLRLEHHVKIRVHRYQLLSEKLTLERTPRGVVVDGAGRVAFCPCDDPPISFGFRRAIVAPPTDLYVKQPTVYVGSVPVFWLPVLWLRAPDRLGLLAPRIAWRGEDGLNAGAGVHVPVGGRRGPTLESVDLFASGYLKGGVDLESQIATARSSTSVRYDRLRESLLAVDSHGVSQGRSGAGAAWRVDAVRGARGRRATIALEPAARRYDRARALVGVSGDTLTATAGATTTADRGGALRNAGAIGPDAFFGASTALGRAGSLAAELDAGSVHDSVGQSMSHVTHAAELDGDALLGPVLVSMALDDRAFMRSAAEGASAALLYGSRLRAELPLGRAFGDAPDPLLHRIEPFVEGGVRGGLVRQNAAAPIDVVDPLADERVMLGSAGLETALGRWGDRSALELSVRGGWVGRFSAPERVAAASLAGDARWAALRVDAAAAEHQAQVGRGVIRLGPRDGLFTSLHAEARRDTEPLLARALVARSWDDPGAGWLDSRGVSAGGDVGIPWTRWLASSAGADADVGRRRWLAVRGALGYRHPCGCLSLLASAGRRVGRGGFDAEITLDLMP